MRQMPILIPIQLTQKPQRANSGSLSEKVASFFLSCHLVILSRILVPVKSPAQQSALYSAVNVRNAVCTHHQKCTVGGM